MVHPARSSRISGRWGNVKRIVEASLVALPAVLAILALATGTFAFTVETLITVAALLALALLVYTQHLAGYLILLGLGVAALFQSGLVALAFWVFGGLYLLIAIVNLALILSRWRRVHARPSE